MKKMNLTDKKPFQKKNFNIKNYYLFNISNPFNRKDHKDFSQRTQSYEKHDFPFAIFAFFPAIVTAEAGLASFVVKELD
jgi:hypothetical protein